MNTQWAVNTILRYHERVQTAPKRKRGNPPDVLKAFKFLRGGKFCELCGLTEYEKRIELHHKDGNWRNYLIPNLGFYCSDCHLDDHNGNWSNTPNQMEGVMSQVVTKFTWEGQPSTTLFSKVEEYVNQGYSVEEACRELSKDSEILFGRYFKPDSLSGTYWRRRRIMQNRHTDGAVIPTPKSTVAAAKVTGMVMHRNEAIEFWRDMKRWGITVVNSNDR